MHNPLTMKETLAERFEEDHAGGYGDVEGFDGAGGGKGDDEIAALAGKFVEAVAFATHDNAGGRRVIDLGVGLVGIFVEANEPVAGLLQFFHGTGEIGDLCDGEMRESSGGGASDRVGESGGAAFGDDDAVCSGGERGANDGAEVVGVFDAVEKDDETTLAIGGVGGGENVFECGGSAGGGDSDDALMIAGVGKAIELSAVFEADGDAALARELHDFFDAGVLPAFGDEDAVEGVAGFEGFADGVDAGETVHGKQSTVFSRQLTVFGGRRAVLIEEDGSVEILRRTKRSSG